MRNREQTFQYLDLTKENSKAITISRSELLVKLGKGLGWVDSPFIGAVPPSIQRMDNSDLTIVYSGPETGHGLIANRVFEAGEKICVLAGEVKPLLNKEINPYGFTVGFPENPGVAFEIDGTHYRSFSVLIQAAPAKEVLGLIQFQSKHLPATANTKIEFNPYKYGPHHVVVTTERIEKGEVIALDYINAMFIKNAVKKGISPCFFHKFGGKVLSKKEYTIQNPLLLTIYPGVEVQALGMFPPDKARDFTEANGARRLVALPSKKRICGSEPDFKVRTFSCTAEFPFDGASMWAVIKAENVWNVPAQNEINAAELKRLAQELRQFAGEGYSTNVNAIIRLYDKHAQHLLLPALDEEVKQTPIEMFVGALIHQKKLKPGQLELNFSQQPKTIELEALWRMMNTVYKHAPQKCAEIQDELKRTYQLDIKIIPKKPLTKLKFFGAAVAMASVATALALRMSQ